MFGILLGNIINKMNTRIPRTEREKSLKSKLKRLNLAISNRSQTIRLLDNLQMLDCEEKNKTLDSLIKCRS